MPEKLTIVAIDALEHKLVEEFDCKNLKQDHYGKTNITEFSQPRTIVLWSSFMTGKNREAEILAMGDKEMWNVKHEIGNTFFSKFETPHIIDLPGYNYDLGAHERSRKLLKSFFDTKDSDEKESIRKQYNKDAFDHHRVVKEEFYRELDAGHDLLLGYFSLADVVGHLNFGNTTMMKMIYREMDEIAGKVRGKKLVLSDHGMYAIGVFGDHSEYGFWSTNWKDLGKPKLTDIGKELMG